MPRELTQAYLHNLRDRLLASGLPQHIVDDAIVRARAHAGGKAPRKKKPGEEEETDGTAEPTVEGDGAGEVDAGAAAGDGAKGDPGAA
ncbi:MAG: hypothetical protein WC642_16175 [Nocardioides sp.]|jgi:hypothetical protein